MVTSCKIIVQYHNQDFDIDRIYQFYCTCVYLVLYTFITYRFIYLPPQSRYSTAVSPLDSLVLPLHSYIYLLPIPPPAPNLWQPRIFSISKILSFHKCYKWNHVVLLRLALFTQCNSLEIHPSCCMY